MKSSLKTKNSFVGFQADGGFRAVLVQVASPKAKARLVSSFESPVEGPVSKETLALTANRFAAKDAHWVWVLGRGEYQFSRVDKPSVSDSELEQSLRWLVPFKDVNPQDAAISWIPVPPASNRQDQVYVAACDRNLVSRRAQAAHLAKIELGAVDVREMAQRNIAARISNREVICLLVAEPAGVQMTISRGEDLYLERFIREPLLEPGETDASALRRVGVEIRRSLDFLRNSHPDLPEPAIYIGPTPNRLDLVGMITSELGMPAKNLDLGSIFDWPAGSALVDPAAQARFFSALGACLRL